MSAVEGIQLLYKSMVAMESQWLLWEFIGCYGKLLVAFKNHFAFENHLLLRNFMVEM
jgi:hypothetical protein